MLKGLAYQVTFNATGKSINTLLSPEQEGTTLITGKNEAGKSLNLEMFAFTLFGSEALRGKMTDYKKLKATSSFSIKGQTYNVTRTKNDAELRQKDIVLAQGTSPVNKRIKEILGFGLDVFKISNWCAQGDVQKLSNMKPTERRQMIDEVSGLTQLDGVIVWVKDYVKELKTIANTKAESMVKPIKPEVPEGLSSKTSIAKQLEELEVIKLRRATLEDRAFSAPVAPIEPAEPIESPIPAKPTKLGYPEAPQPPEDYETFGWDEVAERNCSASIEAMPVWLKEVELHTRVLTNKRSEKPIYLGEYTREELADIKAKQKLFDQLEDQQHQKQLLQSKGTVECPKCNHEHFVAGELLKDYPETFEFPEIRLTPDKVEMVEKYLNWEDQVEKIKAQLEDTLERQPMPTEDYKGYQKFVSAKTTFRIYQDSYDKALIEYKHHCLEIDAKFQKDVLLWEQECEQATTAANQRQEAFEKSVEQYQQDLKNFNEATESYNSTLAELGDLMSRAEVADKISTLTKMNDLWVHHEYEVKRYEKDLEVYAEKYSEYEQLVTKREEYELAGKALKEVKLRVKGYLVPSLSKVASQLLNDMTGGERCSIKISENFDIEVDGQALQTLSGSGKDIANLAIRIALGQVLTHKVMPLMMFDEIDAAMDDTRASFTWECIQKVAPRIGQVLLVSHKDLTSQHTIKI